MNSEIIIQILQLTLLIITRGDLPCAFCSIADQSGRHVLNGKLGGENTSLDIPYLSEGFYFLQIALKSENTFKNVKK